MFEDDPRNLVVPHAWGCGPCSWAPRRPRTSHVHHHADDLSRFLALLA
jgi:putative hydrolase of the HAD superfamily